MVKVDVVANRLIGWTTDIDSAKNIDTTGNFTAGNREIWKGRLDYPTWIYDCKLIISRTLLHLFKYNINVFPEAKELISVQGSHRS